MSPEPAARVAPAPTAAPALTFAAGPVLRRAAGALVRNLPAVIVLTALALAPVIVIALASKAPALGAKNGPAAAAIVRFVAMIATGALACTDLVTAAITPAVLADLAGERLSFVAALRRGVASLFLVLGVAIMTSLAVATATITLVIPGLILLGLIYVAVPVAVAEGVGFEAALRRSAGMLRRRWPVATALALAPGAVAFGLALGIGRVAVPHVLAGRVHVPAPAHWHAYTAIVAVTVAVGAAVAAVITAVSYAALRQR